MITKELLKSINQIDINLSERFKEINANSKENILSRTIKLGEEVGELNREVLSKFYARREQKFDVTALEHEFADVIITTLLLAKSMNVDVNEALKSKLDKIENRGGV